MAKRSFVDLIEKQEKKSNKTFTENGAVAYESSGKFVLDFNFKLSQYRNMTESEIKNDFTKVYFEDPMVATKFAFYIGDVRGGLGERKVFRACLDWLADNKPVVADNVLELVPEYTRWDNLIRLVDHPKMREAILDIIVNTLSNDIKNMNEGKSISLLAKWLPSINASSKETKARAKSIIRGLEVTEKDYRQTLSALRSYLKIVEVKASANQWSEIDYEAVPSQANLKYKNAFMKHDEDRRLRYLDSLKKGEVKINASVAQPHEIVRNYNNGSWWGERVRYYDETLEQMWKALPNIAVEDTLVVRDGSGSMTCQAGNSKTTCLDIATALAIYCAEHNSPAWKDKFITFSSRPKFVNLGNCKTLRDKLVRTFKEEDCSNTDIEATMRLILETAVSNKLAQEEMPGNILIISDMQFDTGSRWCSFGWDKSLFEEIAEEYEENGYKLPRIIFWNVCSRDFDTIPMQDNENGLILCSGFSTNNMKMFMSGEVNPYKVILEQINSERYVPVELAIKEVI